MLKKTIKYEDFNGEQVEEDFFFHLSKAELVEIELSHQGGLSEALKRIIAAEDTKAIVDEFKNIILGSYGQKSPDGKRFIKNAQLREEFTSSEAYSTLFMELVTDTDAAIEFINGVIPSGLAEEAAKVAALAPAPVEESVTVLPTPNEDAEIITKKMLIESSYEEVLEMQGRIARGEAKLEE